MNPAIQIDNISKKFCKDLRRSMFYGSVDLSKVLLGLKPNKEQLRNGEFWAIKEVSLEIPKNRILGIVGLNGSGKTTLLRMIAGIYNPDSGSINVDGGVASLFAATTAMNPTFSGRENIFIRGTLFGLTSDEVREQMDSIIEFSELGEFIDHPFGIYSSGMRARLGFSVAAHSNAEILVIDEGLAVGDQRFKVKCFRKLKELREKKTIIIASQKPGRVAKVCDDMLVMDKGSVLHHSSDLEAAVKFYNEFCFAGNNSLGKVTEDEYSFD